MTKKELLDYLDSLINRLKNEKNGIYNEEIESIILLEEKIRNVLYNVENLQSINFEKLDDYINIPDDALNTLTLYKLLCTSENYPLNEEQKKYIIYMFNEFKKIIETKKNEETFSNKKSQKLSMHIASLLDIKNILISKVTINLEDFGLIIKIINGMDASYKADLLNSLSNYMKYVLINRETKEDYRVKR